jgi:hypothetical protein
MKSLEYVLNRQIAFQSSCKANNWSIAYIEDLEETLKQKRGWTKTCMYMSCSNCTKPQKVAIKSILDHKNWCKSCRKRTCKYSIEYVRELVSSVFNAKCISTEIKNVDDILTLLCKNGHDWITTFHKILQKQGCRQCYLKNVTLSLDDAKIYAKQNNGELLSTEYINIRTKLKWKCENDHIWKANLMSIKNGTWCPSCYSTGSFYENITKLTYKELFNQIPSTNRQILNGIELDGYLEFGNLKHAFEVHGGQHNEFIKFFHKTYSKFIWQLERDDAMYVHFHMKIVDMVDCLWIYDIFFYILDKDFLRTCQIYHHLIP